jgi:hypothetical protein
MSYVSPSPEAGSVVDDVATDVIRFRRTPPPASAVDIAKAPDVVIVRAGESAAVCCIAAICPAVLRFASSELSLMPGPSPRKSTEPVTKKATPPRLLADENTSHRFVSACLRLVPGFAIIHIARWQDGSWLGLDDAALLIAGAELGLVLVAFDRAPLACGAGDPFGRE